MRDFPEGLCQLEKAQTLSFGINLRVSIRVQFRIRFGVKLSRCRAGPRVVAVIPIEVRNRISGVLMAGLFSSDIGSDVSSDVRPDAGDENSGDDLARLESYALLAASALDRELARTEGAAHKRNPCEISSKTAARVSSWWTKRELRA